MAYASGSDRQAGDLDTALADTQEGIDGMKAEIEALDDGIRELDKQARLAALALVEEG